MKKSFYLQSLLFCCLLLCSAVAKATVPNIVKDPINITVCAGIDTYLYVTAVDTPGTLAMTYKWQVSTDGTTWSNIKDTLEYTHSATDTLRIHADNSLNGYLYRAIVTNTDGADTSVFGTLTVIHPDAGTILGASSVCLATTMTMSNAVTGGTWTSVTPAIATVGSVSGIVTGVAQGYDTIKYTATNTCGTATTFVVIHVDTVVTALPISGPTATCVGHFINLTNVNVIGTGIWTADNANATVSSTGVVIGAAHGTDIITYAFSNACNSVTSTATITIDTLLSAGTISGLTNICYGSWVHLSETVTGGMWITGSSSVAVVDPSGNVTGVSQGTAVISYLLSNACGISVATTTVTVFADAASITGLDSVGIGLTRTLMDSTIGGMWFSSDTSIAKIDTFTGVVTGRDTGTTMITYTVTNLCGTTSRYLLMHVGPAPTLSAIYGGSGFDSSVCIGATLALFDSTPGGVGQWSITNDSLATISSTGVVTGVKSGLDTVLYTFTTGFGTSVISLPIFVNQPPVIYLTGPTIVSLAGDYFFRGYPYQDWNPPAAPNVGVWSTSNNHMGVIVSVGDSSNLHITSFASFVVLNGGIDTVTYTLHNACGTSHKSWEVKLTTGVPTVNELGGVLKVYPNPTEGEITIDLNSAVTESAHVVVSNILGAKVKEVDMTTNRPYTVKLDEPAGMYILSATTASNGKYESKIVVGK